MFFFFTTTTPSRGVCSVALCRGGVVGECGAEEEKEELVE